MALFINIITLFACFLAMTYCYVLSKRIRAFDNIKDGVGALIEEMIRTTNDLQVAFNSSQKNIDHQYNKLQDKIDEGIAMSEYLTNIIEEAEINITEMRSIKHEILKKNTYDHQISKAQTTLPEAFELRQTSAEKKNTSSQVQSNNTQEDLLEDVVPAGFGTKRKKRPQIIIPGDEYI